MLTRRQLLQHSPALVALGSLAPGFLLRAAEERAADGRILVVVQLSGGNDGLNTVVPFQHDAYRQARPTLAIPAANVLKIDDELGFHPSLRGFSRLLEEGQLAIVQGVGYPQPNRSHFESMDIWHTCQRKDQPRLDGWLGRYLEQSPSAAASDLPAVHLGEGQQPFALAARRLRTPTIRTLDQFQLQASSGEMRREVGQLAAADRPAPDDLLGFVQSSTQTALNVADRLSQLVASQPARSLPATELGRKLGTVAQLIAAGLSTQIYYVELDGFDTHAQQPDAHAGLLRQLGDAVAAFLSDVSAQGAGDRVLLAVFSEFGRRLAENASTGTDHGAAAPMFVAGTRVAPGLIGAHPSLTDLDEGDLRHHTDFRQVYAALLEQWLQCHSEPILGGRFSPVRLVRAG